MRVYVHMIESMIGFSTTKGEGLRRGEATYSSCCRKRHHGPTLFSKVETCKVVFQGNVQDTQGASCDGSQSGMYETLKRWKGDLVALFRYYILYLIVYESPDEVAGATFRGGWFGRDWSLV